MTTAEHNKKLVRALYEDCINTGNLDQLEVLIAPDFTGARGERGPREFRATIEAVLTGFPGVRFEIHDLFGEGDRVAVRWTFRAVHGGRFVGLSPSHAEVAQEGNVIYQVRDGRIVRAWLQADRLGVLQQIGAVPRSFAESKPV
ncbi:ester cyclase [Massilia endophytica]|uniref:ester cyclase n=1 Tax=Massilia endophytica TaxID=2899220 RepID=UPI001E38EEE5|nr:ester cyclase [Massilia endophytica]UGQ49056.1 ester cyclase [Massilia endophytica]